MLSIVATDGGGRTGYANATINVTDVNDNSPEFATPRYLLNVIEEEVNMTVGTVSAMDADDLQNGIVRYICG